MDLFEYCVKNTVCSIEQKIDEYIERHGIEYYKTEYQKSICYNNLMNSYELKIICILYYTYNNDGIYECSAQYDYYSIMNDLLEALENQTKTDDRYYELDGIIPEECK